MPKMTVPPMLGMTVPPIPGAIAPPLPGTPPLPGCRLSDPPRELSPMPWAVAASVSAPAPPPLELGSAPPAPSWVGERRPEQPTKRIQQATGNERNNIVRSLAIDSNLCHGPDSRASGAKAARIRPCYRLRTTCAVDSRRALFVPGAPTASDPCAPGAGPAESVRGWSGRIDSVRLLLAAARPQARAARGKLAPVVRFARAELPSERSVLPGVAASVGMVTSVVVSPVKLRSSEARGPVATEQHRGQVVRADAGPTASRGAPAKPTGVPLRPPHLPAIVL